MIIPIVGASYQMDAVSFDIQRTVNLYPILSESGSSKSIAALRRTAGLKEFITIGNGGIRGGIESASRGFFVSGDGFYEIFGNKTKVMYGTLGTDKGVVQLAENPTQVMVIDGTSGYIFNKTTDTFSQITDINFPVASSLTYQDGYFIVTAAGTGKFYISGLNDGTSWGALDFTTVEGVPDDLVAIVSDKSNLWAFGTKSIEIYQNTGNASFPFQKLIGAFIETGCAAKNTPKILDNSLFWLGSDENGNDIVWKANGYAAQRVSTQAIEKKIAESNDVSESYAWVYHERGHAYYMLQIKGLNTTLCLDTATGLWHERIYRNTTTGAEEQHRGSCHVFFNQMHLVGDRETNQIYEMSLDYYDDNGDPQVWRRITPHYHQEKTLITHAQLELDMEVGQGLQTGQGSDPKIMMRYSDDGGHTWSSELWRSLGKVGQYLTRVKWNKLGRSRDRVYEISGSDPVKIQINEAILNGS